MSPKTIKKNKKNKFFKYIFSELAKKKILYIFFPCSPYSYNFVEDKNRQFFEFSQTVFVRTLDRYQIEWKVMLLWAYEGTQKLSARLKNA